MDRIRNFLARSAFVVLAICALPVFAKDLKNKTVFDLVLGEPFSIRECNFEIVEQEMGIEGVAVAKRNRGLFGKPHHVSRMYRYTEPKPSAGKCFQRVGPFYTSSPLPGVELPPATPPNNQKVKLVYADSSRPAIADSHDIWVGIQDGRLTGIRFYFQGRNEKYVFNTLLKKYGQFEAKESFSIQSPAGEVKTFHSVKWSLPNLQVTFWSLDTRQIGYDPQDAPLGYRSEVGSVTIQYTPAEVSRTDNNPL